MIHLDFSRSNLFFFYDFLDLGTACDLHLHFAHIIHKQTYVCLLVLGFTFSPCQDEINDKEREKKKEGVSLREITHVSSFSSDRDRETERQREDRKAEQEFYTYT